MHLIDLGGEGQNICTCWVLEYQGVGKVSFVCVGLPISGFRVLVLL